MENSPAAPQTLRGSGVDRRLSQHLQKGDAAPRHATPPKEIELSQSKLPGQEQQDAYMREIEIDPAKY